MYALTLTLFRPTTALSAVYNELATTYKLPPSSQLLESLDHTVVWTCDPAVQVYYLENMREDPRRYLFQVRFKTQPKARGFVSLFLSIEEDKRTLHMLSLHFPAKGDRGCSAKILSWLKDMQQHEGIATGFEIEGWSEREGLRFIRERSLKAFSWQERLCGLA
jgi:hypothetical protein